MILVNHTATFLNLKRVAIEQENKVKLYKKGCYGFYQFCRPCCINIDPNSHIIFLALVALKLLVSLMSRLVACSARIVVNKQTNKQTDTQNDYCNARRGLMSSESAKIPSLKDQ